MGLGQKKRLYKQTKHDPRMNKKARRTGMEILGRVGDIREFKDVGHRRSQKSKEK